MISTIAAAHRYRTGNRGTLSDPAHGGGMSETKIVEFEDGSKFVVKNVRNLKDTINEYLCHLIAKVMNIPVPDFIRVDDYTMIMSFIPGDTAVEVDWQEFDRWLTPEMRIFDRVIRNIDRNCGNVIKHAETGVVYAIDHAISLGHYVGRFFDLPNAYEVYSPEKVAEITDGLYGLRQVFVDEGRLADWEVVVKRWNDMTHVTDSEVDTSW